MDAEEAQEQIAAIIERDTNTASSDAYEAAGGIVPQVVNELQPHGSVERRVAPRCRQLSASQPSNPHRKSTGAMTMNFKNETRIAIAALLRIGEPGDGLLKQLVDINGPVAALSIIESVAEGQASSNEAAVDIALTDAEELAFATAIDRWSVRVGDVDGRGDLDKVARLGGRLIIPGDTEWPSMLDDLGPAAPLGLWVRGGADLHQVLTHAVAVVGARAASNYGTKCASDLAWDLASRGITVVSGGAFGIDAAAHRAAIARETPTIAFMAGGLDRFYPAANADLFEQILATGAIVSETAPGMTPMRHRFLLHNRLIAASSKVTVIVEAGWRSGALNTARHALELSRQVAAFPGSVYSASSTGAHRLIREHGAALVTGCDDVLALIDEEDDDR